MARYERVSRVQLAGELFVVGAAQPARFDPQHAVVVADLGQVELARHQRPGRFEYKSGRGRSNHGRILPRSLPDPGDAPRRKEHKDATLAAAAVL